LNLVGAFAKGVEVHNRFGALVEETKEMPPELEDSESEADVGKLADPDSEDEEVEMEKWKVKLGMKEKKGGNFAQNEAAGIEEEIFIGDVGAENRKRMKIKFQVAEVKKPLMAVRRIVDNVIPFLRKHYAIAILHDAPDCHQRLFDLRHLELYFHPFPILSSNISDENLLLDSRRLILCKVPALLLLHAELNLPLLHLHLFILTVWISQLPNIRLRLRVFQFWWHLLSLLHQCSKSVVHLHSFRKRSN
jgi:hypothetical protein